MNTNFRIGLISDDPYHQGLLKGYCQAHRYTFFEAGTDKESITKLLQKQPNMVFFTAPLAQESLDLLRDMSVNHQLPVCCLRDSGKEPNLQKEAIDWLDSSLDTPLDVNQLKDYLHKKFHLHHRFIQDKRNHERRAIIDRRMQKPEQQNEAAHNNQVIKNPLANDHCFMAEPFQIDQRSKSVLFNGKLLNLTRKEYELFELLAKDIDRVFMTHEIINHLWPENNRATKSDLYQYMHLLRKKIEDDPNNPQWILTVKGFGYKLNVASTVKVN